MLRALEDQKFLKLIQRNLFISNSSIFLSLTFAILHRKGKIVLEIPIPARQVTSVAFGGPNLDILYVTTASAPINAAEIGLSADEKQSELAGHLFAVTALGTKGFPGVKVRV